MDSFQAEEDESGTCVLIFAFGAKLVEVTSLTLPPPSGLTKALEVDAAVDDADTVEGVVDPLVLTVEADVDEEEALCATVTAAVDDDDDKVVGSLAFRGELPSAPEPGRAGKSLPFISNSGAGGGGGGGACLPAPPVDAEEPGSTFGVAL